MAGYKCNHKHISKISLNKSIHLSFIFFIEGLQVTHFTMVIIVIAEIHLNIQIKLLQHATYHVLVMQPRIVVIVQVNISVFILKVALSVFLMTISQGLITSHTNLSHILRRSFPNKLFSATQKYYQDL